MRWLLAGLLVVVQVGLCTSAAVAAWPARSDPSSNFTPRFPDSCSTAPMGTKCLEAGVQYLDSARARLHQPPYQLPANFAQLAPDQQVLILTNLDRAVYHLSPIAGLTNELNGDALAGVHADDDPAPGVPGFFNDPHFQYFGSNWAYAYPNIVFAYGAWTYDDGLGSPNAACAPKTKQGCWGHRHNVLLELPKEFSLGGPTAMGVAAGKDHGGQLGYAMVLGRGDAAYGPRYLYKWSDHTAW